MSQRKGNGGLRLAGGTMLAGTMGIIAMAPATAFAAQTETKVFTWNNGEAQPQVPQTMDINGQTYDLVSTGNPVQSGQSKTVTQHFDHSVESSAASLDGLQQSVPSTIQYSQDGFSGTLSRVGIDYTPVYNDGQRTVTTELTGYSTGSTQPSDDVAPATASAQGATNMRRTSVTWEVTARDSSNTPIQWKYTAHYEGSVTTHDFDHYKVVARYSGDLSKQSNAGSWSMTAVYRSRDTQQTNTNQNDQGQTQGEGVTATFDDTGSFQANPENDSSDKSTNDNESDNSDEVGNGNTNDAEGENISENGANTSGYTTADNANASTRGGSTSGTGILGGGFPIIPIAAGVGLLVVAGAVVGIVVSKKNGKGTPGSMATFIPVDIEDVDAELIEYINDGTEDNQGPIATLEAFLSPSSDVPTLIQIPSPGQRFEPAPAEHDDGTPITDELGNPTYAEYYVALGETSSVSTATGETGEDGTVRLDNLSAGPYAVKITHDTDGYGGPEVSFEVPGTGVTQYVTIVADGTDYEYDDETDRNVGNYPGPGSVIVSVTSPDGNPIQGATVDVFRTNLLTDLPSDRLLIVANNQPIYDGQLTPQVKLDATLLANALNGEVPPEEAHDASQEIAGYEQVKDEYSQKRYDAVREEVARQQQLHQQQGQDDGNGNGPDGTSVPPVQPTDEEAPDSSDATYEADGSAPQPDDMPLPDIADEFTDAADGDDYGQPYQNGITGNGKPMSAQTVDDQYGQPYQGQQPPASYVDTSDIKPEGFDDSMFSDADV